MIPLRKKEEFDFYADGVRSHIYEWMVALGGVIPGPIFEILMKSEWNDFYYNEGGFYFFRTNLWVAIFYFYEVNGAPIELRRMTWNWIMRPPKTFVMGACSGDSDYICLFECFVAVKFRDLSYTGAFYDVKGQRVLLPNPWTSFNVWNCRGTIIG